MTYINDSCPTHADYAGDAITEATRAAYLADWAEFAAWCRTQEVDPTVLPIHSVPVAVAASATIAVQLAIDAIAKKCDAAQPGKAPSQRVFRGLQPERRFPSAAAAAGAQVSYRTRAPPAMQCRRLI